MPIEYTLLRLEALAQPVAIDRLLRFIKKYVVLVRVKLIQVLRRAQNRQKKYPSRRHVHETSDFSPEVSTDQRGYHVHNFGKTAGRRVHETVLNYEQIEAKRQKAKRGRHMIMKFGRTALTVYEKNELHEAIDKAIDKAYERKEGTTVADPGEIKKN